MQSLDQASKANFQIRFPENWEVSTQGEEYFFLVQEGVERLLKLHDYAEIYTVPGLYQYLLVEQLRDRSPHTLSALLIDQVIQAGSTATELCVLDMGAGIGLSGDRLFQQGVGTIVGLDILPEACAAAQREFPHVFQAYYVLDLLHLSPEMRSRLQNHRFNCLMCCSALTCHLPQAAFIEAFNLIEDNGWIAFNINQAKLHPENSQKTDFYPFYDSMIQRGHLQVYCTHRYQHRLCLDGKPIEYCAVIGRKHGSLPIT
jgi:hypothetical protein